MNDASAIYGQPAPVMSESNFASEAKEIAGARLAIEASAKAVPHKVAELTADFVATMQTKYLELKKRNVA
jgi:hypothetical protein